VEHARTQQAPQSGVPHCLVERRGSGHADAAAVRLRG